MGAFEGLGCHKEYLGDLERRMIGLEEILETLEGTQKAALRLGTLWRMSRTPLEQKLGT